LTDHVSDSDRAEIEGRMRRDVLAVLDHPEITYHATCLSDQRLQPGRYRVRIVGPLALRGVTAPQSIDLELYILDASLRLLGGGPLRLSSHDIEPVTALAGAIRLKDELAISFDITAVEEPEP
jgi:polyisoprenoid-binding protein YceI